VVVEFSGTERFQIVRCLGAGGMGVVYEAFDREQNATVALKTLHTPSADALLRLKREFRSLQNVQHANLVSLGELIEEQGTWFFTMDLIRGVPLLEYVTRSRSRISGMEQTLSGTSAPVPGTDVFATPRQPFDEERLRSCLQQLARGLAVLHVAGKVHRDVKPSNILVDEHGHLSLLDFGLITDPENDPDWSGENVVGTVAYMAPEQAAAQRVGPEADWYAVGVILYEALTGSLPFSGPSMQVLLAKQRSEPEPPARIVPGVPDDLNQLCIELLRLDPAQRPTSATILARLGVASRASIANLQLARSSSPGNAQAPFVGREPERAVLDGAFADVRAGRGVTVLVHGESGVGKSTLLRAFIDRAAADERVLVLSGRCYEREAVPFKAMDGIIDALAHVLHRMPKVEAAAVVPQRASLLLQAFPVLRRVDVFADARRYDIADPAELRTRMFSAMREMFCRLADRRPLILCIDDLHWADADSMAVLHEILRAPEAPPLLLLASLRITASEAAVRRKLEELPGDVRQVEVRALGRDDARALAYALLCHRSRKVDLAQAEAVAQEAEGHPLFIDELVRHAALHDRPTRARMDLGDVLWSRISRLDALPQRVLELVAVAGTPIDNESLARAVGVNLAELHRQVGVLRAASLVRAMGTRGSDRVEAYHDRVRQAVAAKLDAAAQRSIHQQLARALEASEHPDAEALALHYRLAGDKPQAARYARRAAETASSALAFEQAARLFRIALDELPDDASHVEQLRAIRVRMADELAKAGRGAEAARAYLEASRGASPAEVLDLQRRAAQQLLITGHIDEGIATMRSVLASEGLVYPATPRRALMRAVGLRVRLALRGTRFRPTHESEISGSDLARLDACWHAGLGLTMTDHVRGAVFQGRGLLLGLRAGEPLRLSRSLAFEAAHLAGVGTTRQQRVTKLIAKAEELAAVSKHPHAKAFVLGTRGTAHFLLGEFSAALEACEAADVQFRERCTGVPWEIATMQLWIARSLLHLGHVRALSQRVPEAIRAFQERENRYGVTSLAVSALPFVRLASDASDVALRELREALAHWSGAGFHVQHYYSLYAQLSALLYAVAPEDAEALLREKWPALERSLLLRVQFVRLSMLDARARVKLLAALRARDRSDRDRALVDVERDARRIARERVRWADGLAHLLLGQIAHARGDGERATALATSAVGAFDACDMALHAAVAREVLGRLQGTPQSSATWLSEQGIARPVRFASVFAPMLADAT
jgi:tetratricopeptide (TPR) repeat protein